MEDTHSTPQTNKLFSHYSDMSKREEEKEGQSER